MVYKLIYLFLLVYDLRFVQEFLKIELRCLLKIMNLIKSCPRHVKDVSFGSDIERMIGKCVLEIINMAHENDLSM